MIKKYGVTNKGLDKKDVHVSDILENGFCILRNQIPEDIIDHLKSSADQVYSDQQTSFGKEKLIDIQEEDIVRAPFLSDGIFDQLILNDEALAIVSKILGPKFILHLQNVIINKSGKDHHQSAWHRDIPYQEYILSQPISLSLFYALSPFTQETGGTKLLPKSHQFTEFPSETYIEGIEEQPPLNPGDLLIFDSWLYHAAGYNSSNMDRYGVNHVFTAPFMKQQIDFPKLKGIRTFPERLIELMGGEFEVAKDVTDFRERRFKKLNK